MSPQSRLVGILEHGVCGLFRSSCLSPEQSPLRMLCHPEGLSLSQPGGRQSTAYRLVAGRPACRDGGFGELG